MENPPSWRYPLGHETLRNRTAARTAASTGHSAVTSGQESVGRSTGFKRFCELSLSLVPDIPSQGLPGTEAPTHSGETGQALNVPEEQTGQGASEGTPGCWLPDGSMDLNACGHGDRAAVWHSLSPVPRLEAAGKPGVEGYTWGHCLTLHCFIAVCLPFHRPKGFGHLNLVCL